MEIFPHCLMVCSVRSQHKPEQTPGSPIVDILVFNLSPSPLPSPSSGPPVLSHPQSIWTVHVESIKAARMAEIAGKAVKYVTFGTGARLGHCGMFPNSTQSHQSQLSATQLRKQCAIIKTFPQHPATASHKAGRNSKTWPGTSGSFTLSRSRLLPPAY